MRVLIADANEKRRDTIVAMIASMDGVEVLPTCSTYQEARSMIDRDDPELVLIDVELPGGGGLRLLREFPREDRPRTGLLAEGPEQSIAAWEVGAIDYLMEPISAEKISSCLQRVRCNLDQAGSKTEQLPNQRVLGNPPLDRICVKTGERFVFKCLSELAWIEAERNYVRLHFGPEPDLLRTPISEIERRLDPEVFVRIHRSIIINRMHIREIEPVPGGEYVVVLQNRLRLGSGRMYRDRIRTLLANTA